MKFNLCIVLERLKEVESKELLKLLDFLGGWPVLQKDNWKENDFSWEKTIIKLHEFVGIGEKENNFRTKATEKTYSKVQSENKKSSDTKEQTDSEDESKLIEIYPEFMFEMALLLGAEDSNETKQELFDALELGIALNQLLNGKKFKSQSKVLDVNELQIELDTLKWLELFDRFKLEKVDSFILNKNIHVYDNLKKLKEIFKPRDFANYLLWRVVDFSSLFLHSAVLDHVFKLNKQTYGLLDKEQRWKYCTRIANKYAELATGSLYVREYFPNESRTNALNMANKLIEEFNRTLVEEAQWMDKDTLQQATEQLKTLKVFMGYDEQLLDYKKVENYYGKPKKDFSESFLYLGVQLNVQKTDKRFKHKFRNERDWTEYAKPTSSKASYNSRDHTICKF